MSINSPSPKDTTRHQPPNGGGMDMSRTFTLCPISHKGSVNGAQYLRGHGFLRCASCYAKLKAGG